MILFQDKFVVDEDEQKIDNLSVPLSLLYCLEKVEENSDVKMVFLNLGPMTIMEYNRKSGEQAQKTTAITLMSHFRLLRNVIDSYEAVLYSINPVSISFRLISLTIIMMVCIILI